MTPPTAMPGTMIFCSSMIHVGSVSRNMLLRATRRSALDECVVMHGNGIGAGGNTPT